MNFRAALSKLQTKLRKALDVALDRTQKRFANDLSERSIRLRYASHKKYPIGLG